jgi:hypothetical protein
MPSSCAFLASIETIMLHEVPKYRSQIGPGA